MRIISIDRNLAQFWSERGESHDDKLAVPERGENVRVALGQADGLDGELEGEGGDQVDGVEVPHAQVAVLVSVQKVVVAGQQT